MKVLSVDPGTKHLGMCVFDTAHDTIQAWNVVGLSGVTASALRMALTDFLIDVQYDTVIIESQPPKNPSMKKVECWLQMYFAMHHKPCHVVPALFKLRHLEEYISMARSKKLNYTDRKKMAVSAIHTFLESSSSSSCVDARAMFMAAPKKDDLADCLLQALAWKKKLFITNNTNAPGEGHHQTNQGDDQPSVRA